MGTYQQKYVLVMGTYQQEYLLMMGTYMLPLYNVLVMGTYMLPLYVVLEASRPAYRRTIGLLFAYYRPDIGVRSNCYRRTIGFWFTVLVIVYSRVNCLIDTKRGGALLIQ